jgi:hypothetical protein
MKRMLICAAAAMAAIGGGGVAAVAASSSAPLDAAPVHAGVSAATVGGVGWQADYVYNVPAGAGGLFFHYPCPGNLKPDAGKFLVNFSDPAANSVHLIGEGIRTDIPGMHEWQWNINWFGAASPAGAQITFNVHCSKQ